MLNLDEFHQKRQSHYAFYKFGQVLSVLLSSTRAHQDCGGYKEYIISRNFQQFLFQKLQNQLEIPRFFQSVYFQLA